MFAVAVFMMPPLYEAACRLLGINGKNVTVQAAPAAVADRSRLVNIEFVANVYRGTPLQFEPPSPATRRVHPGQIVEVSYHARNLSDQVLWAQAVHSIIPGRYGRHVNVLACFCFDNQKFEPGEARTLTFGFTVSPELPPEQSTLSISYTFFKLDNPPEDSP